MTAGDFEAYLADARSLTLSEIEALVPANPRYRAVLYDLMLEYPLRSAKALRPALCIASCRALGGDVEPVLRSAAAIELFHNAFLIHDDVEDGSERRRDAPTLHVAHGAPIAVNVGDAMLALALQPLLDNMRAVGLGKALRILQVIARMARESAEGQALELDWIRRGCFDLRDADYVRMVYKKTSWYTFIAPVLIGAIVAGVDEADTVRLRRFAALLGIAFQIQDDVLNLTAEGDAYGKETAGDLWEGKRTLVLLHALRRADDCERRRAVEILAKPRPVAVPRGSARSLRAGSSPTKTEGEIRRLRTLIDRAESLGHARAVAADYAARARRQLSRCSRLEASVHREFLEGLVDYVVERRR